MLLLIHVHVRTDLMQGVSPADALPQSMRGTDEMDDSSPVPQQSHSQPTPHTGPSPATGDSHMPAVKEGIPVLSLDREEVPYEIYRIVIACLV